METTTGFFGLIALIAVFVSFMILLGIFLMSKHGWNQEKEIKEAIKKMKNKV